MNADTTEDLDEPMVDPVDDTPEPRLDLAATYSPEDNKLRLYSVHRLDKPTYDRIWSFGFRWAPKQKLFVAPAWAPAREDVLIELCGDIDAEDQTLDERSAVRAERFAGYRANRQRDGDAHHSSAVAISERFAGGQPIIVGHHSERRARRDHDRMDRGFRKALSQWETAAYWRERAAATKAHASYKADPRVRHRRIRTLEADRRRYVSSYTPDPRQTPQVWDGVTQVWLTNGSRGGHWRPESSLAATKAHAERWIAHIDRRLEYERAMLDEAGGLGVDRADIPLQVGGRVRVRDRWYPIVRINRADGGAVVSVSASARGGIIPIERIDQVSAPEPGDAEQVRAAVRKPTLCNYPGEGFTTYTKREWMRLYSDHRGSEVIKASETYVEHRVRREWRYRGGEARHLSVFVSDLPIRYPPAPTLLEGTERPVMPSPETDEWALAQMTIALAERRARAEADDQESARIAELRAAVDGVQPVEVVHAPQLFPTPAALAVRLIDLAGIKNGDRVLEPSAGTGNLVWEIARRFSLEADITLTAVEIVPALAERLASCFPDMGVICGDFLEVCKPGVPSQGYDVIVMNPPFAGAADVRHIIHAITLLKPGGLIAGICAGGPRQADTLRPMVEQCGGTWEPLPAGSFAECGTNANTVMFAFRPEW